MLIESLNYLATQHCWMDFLYLVGFKKVPTHGKISGINGKEMDVVRVIIPDKNTKLILTISNPAEMLVRSVTPDGKVLGLTNYAGKIIYVIDQEKDTFLNETGLKEIDFLDEKTSKRLFKASEELNKDPLDILSEVISAYLKKEESQIVSSKERKNG